MLSFEEWLVQEGVAKSLRGRVNLFKSAIKSGIHPDLNLPVDYKGTNDARKDLHAAAWRAQQINQKSPNGVTVYHSIVPNRITRTLDSILRFLTSKNPKEEQSVSVTKGIWDANLVLVGTAKKLVAYWDTDIHTKPVPTSHHLKIPLDAHRPSDFRPYDEALIKLGDVNWKYLYINDENDHTIQSVGGMDNLRKITLKYGLILKNVGSASEPPVKKRYEIQKIIEKFSNFNNFLYLSILQNNTDPEVVNKLSNIDIHHHDLVKHPEKRADEMQKTFHWLRDVYNYIFGN